MNCLCKLALNWRTIRIENLAVIFKKRFQYICLHGKYYGFLLGGNVKLFYTVNAYPFNPYVSSANLIHWCSIKIKYV